jgi:hypothetical protein
VKVLFPKERNVSLRNQNAHTDCSQRQRETREYAYGPAGSLPDAHVGTFSDALRAEANKSGWIVISMKDDWKRIFAFEK